MSAALELFTPAKTVVTILSTCFLSDSVNVLLLERFTTVSKFLYKAASVMSIPSLLNWVSQKPLERSVKFLSSFDLKEEVSGENIFDCT